MNGFEIKPYAGVGSLTFGMSRQDVARVLGAPDSSLEDHEAGTLIEYRSSSALQTSFDRKTSRLVLVGLYAPLAGVGVDGHRLDWANSRGWYEYLRRSDPSARETFGISVFFRYGISTSGLLQADQGDKSVTAFERGQWNESDRTLKPLP